MSPDDGLEGAGESGVSLGNGVSRGAIAVGVSGDIGTIAVCSEKESGVSISRPLAKTLGRPGNEGGGSSGVGSDSGKTVSVSVGVSSIGVGSSVSVSSVQKGGVSLSISISRPLAIQVQVARGGGGSDLSGEAIGGTETIGVGVSSIGVGESVSVSSVEESGISLSLGISGPLAIVGSASIAGGLAVGGAHTGPVGVGVEEGGGVAQISSLSLSRDSDSSASNNLREEREVRSRSLEEALCLRSHTNNLDIILRDGLLPTVVFRAVVILYHRSRLPFIPARPGHRSGLCRPACVVSRVQT